MIKIKETTKFTPKMKQLFLTVLSCIIFFLALFMSGSGSSNFFTNLISLCIFIGLPFYIYISLLYSSLSFIVDENSIIINTGIINKKSKIIPFNKIQNINLKRGLIMRMYGMADVDIWTSSPSQMNINNGQSQNESDGKVTLNLEDAEWLRNFIMSHPSQVN